MRTLTTTAWARAALNDHRGGETIGRRVGSPPASGPEGRAWTDVAGTRYSDGGTEPGPRH